jgi:hypothetical protein
VAVLPVVEGLQVLEDRIGQLDAGPLALQVQQLDRHPWPERLDYALS